MAKYILLTTTVSGISAETMAQFSTKKYSDLEEASAAIREVFCPGTWRLFPLSDFQARWNEGTTEVNHYLTPDCSYMAVMTIKKKGAKNG